MIRLSTSPTTNPIQPNSPADLAAIGDVFFMVKDRIHPTIGNKNERTPKPIESLSSVGKGGGGLSTLSNSSGIFSYNYTNTSSQSSLISGRPARYTSGKR